MATTKTRINFYATPKIENFIKKYTDDLGMNQGAFISMCISEYVKQDEMLHNMSTIQETMMNLQNLVKSVKKEGE